MAEAFYAEDSPILVREELAAVAPDGWSELRFETAPVAAAPPLRMAGSRRSRALRSRRRRRGVGRGSSAREPSRPALRIWRFDERVHYRAMAPARARGARRGEGSRAVRSDLRPPSSAVGAERGGLAGRCVSLCVGLGWAPRAPVLTRAEVLRDRRGTPHETHERLGSRRGDRRARVSRRWSPRRPAAIRSRRPARAVGSSPPSTRPPARSHSTTRISRA